MNAEVLHALKLVSYKKGTGWCLPLRRKVCGRVCVGLEGGGGCLCIKTREHHFQDDEDDDGDDINNQHNFKERDKVHCLSW